MLLLLITRALIVHLHIDELVLVIVAARASHLTTRLALVLLLHPLVFRSTVLEPNFNLKTKRR